MTGVITRRVLGPALVLTLSLGGVSAIGAAPVQPAEAAAPPVQRAAAPTPGRPNVVVILTDDQTVGTLDVMPNVRQLIMDEGAQIRNGIIPTPLCCPSRASLLTGQHAHTTGVWTNNPENHGAWAAFQPHEDHTLATALDARGYRTGLFGKYLNAWGGTVPPGWDVFRSFRPLGYFDYRLEGTGEPVDYGDKESDYSTDVLADLAVDFLAESSRPAFVWFAPFAPHWPRIPAPRHEGTLPPADLSDVAAFNEANVSDKPRWLRRPKVDPEQQQLNLTRQRETLLAVDEAVGRLVPAAGAEPTLFVFLSDNGLLNGSHRLTGKDLPYDRSVRVPMGIRYSGVIAPSHPRRIVTNVDLTATILDITGATLPGVEGISLLSDKPRRHTVIEQTQNETDVGIHPAYCGIRSARYLYVEYDDHRGRELYDYATDPEELHNRAGSTRYRDQVAKYRQLARQECRPRPPGFSWN
jgi:N-acetylglucosamine-6-sulfatase